MRVPTPAADRLLFVLVNPIWSASKEEKTRMMRSVLPQAVPMKQVCVSSRAARHLRLPSSHEQQALACFPSRCAC